jgi:predicted SprT family Zn-dependent metalloprotease
VLHDDGTLHNFTLRVGGKPYRCACGCNVFHKPDREDLGLYQCNACEQQFEAA